MGYIQQPSSSTSAPPPPPPSSLNVLHILETVEDRLDALSQNQEKFASQVGRLLNQRDEHCHTIADVYQNVTALLTTTTHLSTSQKTLEETIRDRVDRELQAHRGQLLEANAAQMDRLETQVRRLLENFKDELLYHTQQNATVVKQITERVETFNDRLSRVEETQRASRTEFESLGTLVRRNLEEKIQAMDKDLSVKWERCDQICRTLEQKMQLELPPALQNVRDDVEAIASSLDKLRTESNTAVQQIARRVQQNTNEVTSIKQELKQSIESTETRITTSTQQVTSSWERASERLQTLEAHITGAQRELIALSTRTDDVKQQVARGVEGSKEALRTAEQTLQTIMNEQWNKREAELDKRHRKLVESVHQALAELSKNAENGPGGATAALLATLQQDIHTMRETLHHHSIAIDAQRMEGSLDGAFSELKDWLQDVERRMVSKAQVDDLMSTVTAQLHQFKQQTINAESLLGQRLDAERAARENDVSHHSVQLQKLHHVLKR